MPEPRALPDDRVLPGPADGAVVPGATPSPPETADTAPPAEPDAPGTTSPPPSPPDAGPAGRRLPGRRAVLLGGLGLAAATVTAGALIEQDVLPGRVRLLSMLGLDGPDGVVPDVAPGPVESGSFRSAARLGATTRWLLARPPAAAGASPDRLPVCVVLPGRSATERSLLDLGLHRFLADAVRRGVPPFALACVGGGESYWHARREGGDTGRMVVEEFLPLLARLGLAAGPDRRVALLGWSMGGYGALLLGERLGAQRVAAIGAMGPALFRRYADVVPGAFDDAADLAAHDVYAGRDRLRGITVRIDCGLGDPFLPAAREFVDGMRPSPQGGFPRGGHTDGFWRRMVPAQLDLIGHALT